MFTCNLHVDHSILWTTALALVRWLTRALPRFASSSLTLETDATLHRTRKTERDVVRENEGEGT